MEESGRLKKRLGLRFALLSDPKRVTISAYGVAMRDREIAVPAVFVVDSRRRILLRHVGETLTDRPSAEKIIEALSRGL